jgi:hypothetical protein
MGAGRDGAGGVRAKHGLAVPSMAVKPEDRRAAAVRGVVEGALGGFLDERLYVVLDTTVLWNTFCVVQVALVWRGRTVPVA